uniref:Uncharacterized protein n=1 Tax=Glossina austeni TaxID=7395 RepID=A0A1A9VIW9_GLOAU
MNLLCIVRGKRMTHPSIMCRRGFATNGGGFTGVQNGKRHQRFILNIDETVKFPGSFPLVGCITYAILAKAAGLSLVSSIVTINLLSSSKFKVLSRKSNSCGGSMGLINKGAEPDVIPDYYESSPSEEPLLMASSKSDFLTLIGRRRLRSFRLRVDVEGESSFQAFATNKSIPDNGLRQRCIKFADTNWVFQTWTTSVHALNITQKIRECFKNSFELVMFEIVVCINRDNLKCEK